MSAIESRRAHFDELFSKLQQAGIARGDLYDAWDFTVASTPNITDRMLSIRDRGLADLGDNTPGDGNMQGNAPDFTVTSVLTKDDPTNPLNNGHEAQNMREVTGTYQVPCFLSTGCSNGSGDYQPGGHFNLGSNGVPQQNGTMTARFTCNIPRCRRSPRPARDPAFGTSTIRFAPRCTGTACSATTPRSTRPNVRQLGTTKEC